MGWSIGNLFKGIASQIPFIGPAIGAASQYEYADRDYGLQSAAFGLQKESFEYQKEMNQKMMDREDNAVQRRIADLRAAGLSPTLAAGSAASSAAIPNLPAPDHKASAFKAPNTSTLSEVFALATMAQQLASGSLDNQLKQSQVDTFNQRFISDIEKTKSGTALAKSQKAALEHNIGYARDNKLPIGQRQSHRATAIEKLKSIWTDKDTSKDMIKAIDTLEALMMLFGG